MKFLFLFLWLIIALTSLAPQRPDSLSRQHKKLIEKANKSVEAAAQKAQADPYYPQFHLRTKANWINDPNGPIYFAGEYHMFFQHNPYDDQWGNMSWGHAVSRDLVHWRHLPIVLTPNPDSYDAGGVFSGCCVNDDGVPTIIYTGVQPEVQCLAMSYDSLQTFRKYKGNPVIETRPRDDLEGFRDPFVWKEDDMWYGVIGSGIKGKGGTALLYKSPDLLTWNYLHPLCIGFGRNWECPNFFPLGEKWLLVVSPHGEVKYSVGDYKNHRFHPGQWRRMDFGGRPGFYAPNCLKDAKGRRIMWGWIHGGGSEGHPWNGMLSLPRVLSLSADNSLRMQPLPELKSLRNNHIHVENVRLVPDSLYFMPEAKSNTFELLVEFEPGNSEGIAINVLQSPDGKNKTTIFYDAQNLRLSSGDYSGTFQLLPDEPVLQLHIFVDKSVIEVFANQRECLTVRRYPDSADKIVSFFCNGRPARIRRADFWEMNSI